MKILRWVIIGSLVINTGWPVTPAALSHTKATAKRVGLTQKVVDSGFTQQKHPPKPAVKPSARLIDTGLTPPEPPVKKDRQLGKASRQEKGGWVYAHLEGTPRQIGFQYGYLLAGEIDDANRALQLFLKNETKKDWEFYRQAAKRMFWAKIDREYQQELEGMAAGLRARGFHYDAIDMTAHNGWIELAWYYVPYLEAKQKEATSKAPPYCSAFIATGSATADGKIVMAHNAWVHYLIGQRWNLVLDIVPLRGHRILMDAWPGFIHSGDDFAINTAGLVITETTIGGYLNFNEQGVPEFVRARKAAQYANTLDDFARLMKAGNNGGYANTWLVGDIKSNEIGKLELGLKNVTFQTTSDGAFIGSNFPENPKLIAEECTVDLTNFSNSCSDRKARWIALMKNHKGKIGAAEAQQFLADNYDEVLHKQGSTGSTLNGHCEVDERSVFGATPYYPMGTVNGKVVTADLARRMAFWARLGFSDGSEFMVKPFLEKHPEYAWQAPLLRDIKANPWVMFEAKKR
ncbi:MAG: peptidase C45 [Acidobacteria bacterium]|nr:peptidase C45 [Acidobacteriota bacterium]